MSKWSEEELVPFFNVYDGKISFSLKRKRVISWAEIFDNWSREIKKFPDQIPIKKSKGKP